MMHVIHLGLLFVCNGSSMTLVMKWSFFRDRLFSLQELTNDQTHKIHCIYYMSGNKFRRLYACPRVWPQKLGKESSTSLWRLWQRCSLSECEACQGIQQISQMDCPEQDRMLSASFHWKDGNLIGFWFWCLQIVEQRISRVWACLVVMAFGLWRCFFSCGLGTTGSIFFWVVLNLSCQLRWAVNSAQNVTHQAHLASKLFKKNSDILLTAKAYNGRVILQWLCEEVHAASLQEGAEAFDPRFKLISAAMNLCHTQQLGICL